MYFENLDMRAKVGGGGGGGGGANMAHKIIPGPFVTVLVNWAS